jgi:hypothetical protein
VVRDHPDPPSRPMVQCPGGLAQLGEHLLCKQGVVGSIPSSSTNLLDNTWFNTKVASVSQDAEVILLLIKIS